MKITIIELLNLVAKYKAPEKIKIYDDIFELIENHYYLNGILEKENDLLYKMSGGYAILNDVVEIIQEENDEWEDIEELDTYHQGNECLFIDKYYGNITGNLVDEVIADKINSLIKNQKYLKEKLESKDD